MEDNSALRLATQTPAEMPMIERVARRLADENGMLDQWRDPHVSGRHLALARIVLREIRNPTKTMQRAYKECLRVYINGLPEETRAKAGPFGYKVSPRIKAHLRWQAMVDAALGEPQPDSRGEANTPTPARQSGLEDKTP